MKVLREELDWRQKSGQLYYIRNNSGGLKKGKHFIRFGRKGSPDLLLFLPEGRTVHIETKSTDGELSPDQKKYRELIMSLGHEYVVLKNQFRLDDILNTKCNKELK